MRVSKRLWILFLLLAITGSFLWYHLSYPQLAFVDVSISRKEALKIAKEYLHLRREDPSQFKSAVVFTFDYQANRYLQRAVGFDGLKEFITENNFDMFFWLIRFFKEQNKEEYRLTVSSKSGEITSFSHTIDETAARDHLEREEAKIKVKNFLKKNFGFQEESHSIQADMQRTYDHRIDFILAWQKNSVNIPWSSQVKTGTGKLVMGATVSGEEILSFSKNTFIVPDQFNRYLDKEKEVGRNLSLITYIFYFLLFISAVCFIIHRRNHLAMHTTKRLYIVLSFITFGLMILSYFNYFQEILFDYPSSIPLRAHLIRHYTQSLIHILFASVILLIPGLAGELLHYELFKERKEGGFLYYIHSTFFSKTVAQKILLGYLTCLILLGTQSILTFWGQKFCGVWIEHSWMVHSSTAYVPFLAALTTAFKASLSEEILYRFFGISCFKKWLDYLSLRIKPGWPPQINLWLAVAGSSALWGFSHSGYPVFPMWFRGVEVTILGLILSTVYLRCGLIAVITAHFLFDGFWASASYLLGTTVNPIYFYGAVGVLILPLGWAAINLFINQKGEEKPMLWKLNKHQEFNLNVLKSYLSSHQESFTGKNKEEIKKEIAAHGWDIAVVETALEDPQKRLNS